MKNVFDDSMNFAGLSKAMKYIFDFQSKKYSLLGFSSYILSGDVYAFYECLWFLMFLDGETVPHGKWV